MLWPAIALGAALLYLAGCAIWPFTDCGGCDGGKRRSGKAWRDHGRCGGTGRRVRWAARAMGRR